MGKNHQTKGICLVEMGDGQPLSKHTNIFVSNM